MTSDVNELSLLSVLEELARTCCGTYACVDGDIRLTYPELRERAHRLAQALRGQGIGEGDRILWLGQNSFRILECVLASAATGAMFCPVNWRLSAREMAFIIDDLRPALIIWQETEIGETAQEARQIAEWNQGLWLRHDAAGDESYEGLLADVSPQQGAAVATDPAGPVLIVYTAAFEGTPNGAMLSQNALLYQSLIVQRTQDISGSTVFLNSGPMFHVGTLMTTFATFMAGGTNVFIRRTDAETLCRIIHQERCTEMFLVPKLCADMVSTNADARYDLSCLRSPALFPEWDRMVSVNPRDLRNGPYGYGQTEVNGLVTWAFYALPGDAGVSGRPAPGTQIRIINDEDEDVPVGEAGEIAVRGPGVMIGFWNRKELNARRQRGGWHHTNDLGRRETDGSISFIGPKTQMIKSGIENIYPAEVEACLKQHEAVADAAIIGVPDPVFTQSVKAIVQIRAGKTVTAEHLIEWCRTRLASYKKPRWVEFVSAIPRTPAGVVDYRLLDTQFGGGNYPGEKARSVEHA